jgi:hypothetical protein
MKRFTFTCLVLVATIGMACLAINAEAEKNDSSAKTAAAPSEAELERTRRTVKMLDDVYKQTIVLITDKYVHDENDFPAGSAAVTLFKNITEKGWHKVRLIDATGSPYKPENVARDEFEKQGIAELKNGKDYVEEVVTADGKHHLRVLTPVPVVMEKCVMCHAHYLDAKEGEPIGAISYSLVIY